LFGISVVLKEAAFGSGF
jgi:hypothetical protein